jgi:ABC-type lipoprotein export system ATPase subunit
MRAISLTLTYQREIIWFLPDNMKRIKQKDADFLKENGVFFIFKSYKLMHRIRRIDLVFSFFY